MPTPLCLEDTYEYRVKKILKRLHRDFVGDEVAGSFVEYLYENAPEVGQLFLDDIESYMGLDQVIEE